jgi:fumarylpyruvate hydrolase
MNYVVTAPEVPTVPVSGTDDVFPVHRIYCIGRNYEAHAREMGKDPDRDPPFFFHKPADAVVVNSATVPYPPATENFHYEAEMVVAIGRDCVDVEEENALEYVYGYAVGIDLTRRDLQLEAREKGRPWDAGKAFDHSAPCSAIHPVADIGHPLNGAIWLTVNGEVKQSADISDLIWSVAEMISILSKHFSLKPGDLIYTGTPAGVGPVNVGDKIVVAVEGVDELEIEVV